MTTKLKWTNVIAVLAAFLVPLLGSAPPASAFGRFLDEFLARYPGVSSDLDTCGVCHFDFDGRGRLNPYRDDFDSFGLAGAEPRDADADGFVALDEINSGFFPGYNCTNFIEAINVPASLALAIAKRPASTLPCVAFVSSAWTPQKATNWAKN